MKTATKRNRAQAEEVRPVPCYRIPRRYTAGQLVKLYRMCKADPDGFTLVVGDRPDGYDRGDEFTPEGWLDWFRAKLWEKVSRTASRPGRDRDNSALRRLLAMKAGRYVIRRSDLNGIRSKRVRAVAEGWLSEAE